MAIMSDHRSTTLIELPLTSAKAQPGGISVNFAHKIYSNDKSSNHLPTDFMILMTLYYSSVAVNMEVYRIGLVC